MMDDELLTELFQIKEELAVKYGSAYELTAAAHKYAQEHPLPPAGSHRKMIDGFPRGQSVGDDDEMMKELREIREKMWADAGGDMTKFLASCRQPALAKRPQRPKAIKKPRKPGSFRTPKAKGFTTSHDPND